MGSFRIFRGCAGAAGDARYGKLGWFRIFGSSTGPPWLKLGSFRRNRGQRTLCMPKLGSFRIFAVWELGSFRIIGNASGTRLGSFRIFWVVGLVRLGSFRIFGSCAKLG